MLFPDLHTFDVKKETSYISSTIEGIHHPSLSTPTLGFEFVFLSS